MTKNEHSSQLFFKPVGSLGVLILAILSCPITSLAETGSTTNGYFREHSTHATTVQSTPIQLPAIQLCQNQSYTFSRTCTGVFKKDGVVLLENKTLPTGLSLRRGMLSLAEAKQVHEGRYDCIETGPSQRVIFTQDVTVHMWTHKVCYSPSQTKSYTRICDSTFFPKCHIQYFSGAIYNWFRVQGNLAQLITSTNPNGWRPDPRSNNRYLTIAEVKAKDTGDFICQRVWKNRIANAWVHLNVTGCNVEDRGSTQLASSPTPFTTRGNTSPYVSPSTPGQSLPSILSPQDAKTQQPLKDVSNSFLPALSNPPTSASGSSGATAAYNCAFNMIIFTLAFGMTVIRIF